MDEKPLPWPQKGDQLFNPSEDWWLSAYIQPWNKNFHAYAMGYKMAGDIISDVVTGADRGHESTRDYVVYPVVFLYRHYIELRLKEIFWLEAGSMIGRKVSLSIIGSMNCGNMRGALSKNRHPRTVLT